jgi:hypothetical protein
MKPVALLTCLAVAMSSGARSLLAQGISQDTLPDNHLLFTLPKVNGGFQGGNQYLPGFVLSMELRHGIPAFPLDLPTLVEAVRRGEVTGVLTYPTDATTPIAYEVVRHRGAEDVYMKTTLGYFLWESAVVRDEAVDFVINWWYTPPARSVDVGAVEIAHSLLADSLNWHKHGDRQCDDDRANDRWSLFCALKHASLETMGECNHHNTAMNAVRFIIDELIPNHGFEHTPMDYYNADSTTHQDILQLLASAKGRLQRELAARVPPDASLQP